MKEQKNQKLVIAALLAALTLSAAGCSSNTETDAKADTAATTTTAVSNAAETTTTTAAAVSSQEPEESSMADTADVSVGGFKTQYELIECINENFGLDVYSKNTVEEDIEAAKNWNIIDDSFDKDAPVTAEFLVRSLVIASGIDPNNFSDEEIIDIAVEAGIIDDKDLSKVDLSKAGDMVVNAGDIWSHGKYDYFGKNKQRRKELKNKGGDSDAKDSKADASNSSEAEKDTKTDAAPYVGEFKTQYDMLAYINSKFGLDLNGDMSVEENIQTAKLWHIIDDDFDKDAAPTAEFFVNTLAKAYDHNIEGKSVNEMAEFLWKKGIIDDSDISKIDLSKAGEIIDYASKKWLNSTFSYDDLDIDIKSDEKKDEKEDKKEDETPVISGDVTDLTSTISSSDIQYDGKFIHIPLDVAVTIMPRETVKLPADSAGNGGGTYFVTSVSVVNEEATIQGDKLD